MIYYYSNAYSSQSKGNSAVVLNVFLWLVPWFIPAVYGLVTSMYIGSYVPFYKKPTFLDWLEDHGTLIMYINLGLLVLYMYFFTNTIKKWKGKPEA